MGKNQTCSSRRSGERNVAPENPVVTEDGNLSQMRRERQRERERERDRGTKMKSRRMKEKEREKKLKMFCCSE
jgi:hypothetical protein